jgi:hypothetical protein
MCVCMSLGDGRTSSCASRPAPKRPSMDGTQSCGSIEAQERVITGGGRVRGACHGREGQRLHPGGAALGRGGQEHVASAGARDEAPLNGDHAGDGPVEHPRALVLTQPPESVGGGRQCGDDSGVLIVFTWGGHVLPVVLLLDAGQVPERHGADVAGARHAFF